MWIAPASRENAKAFDTVFAITEVVVGFVPNSMLIMARDPELLAAFSELSALILIRPGRLNPGLKALIMYMVSRSAGCQYCAAHTANLAAIRDVPTRKIEALGQFEQSPEFSEPERAALRFAQAAGQVPNGIGHSEFAELSRHFDDDQILEMVAVLALLGFLNRWNDTLGTPLEAGPRNFAECHLADTGWKVGKHASAMWLDSTPRRSMISLSARVFLWALEALAAESTAIEREFTGEGSGMSDVVYVSKVRVERKVGLLRIAYLPGESHAVTFGVHGAVAQHYKLDPAALGESHASTLDYVIAAAAG